MMDDAKRVYRDVEQQSKEAWRKQDGEDVADKVGNVGDEARKDLGNLGDDARRAARNADDGFRREGTIDDPNVVPPHADRPR